MSLRCHQRPVLVSPFSPLHKLPVDILFQFLSLGFRYLLSSSDLISEPQANTPHCPRTTLVLTRPCLGASILYSVLTGPCFGASSASVNHLCNRVVFTRHFSRHSKTRSPQFDTGRSESSSDISHHLFKSIPSILSHCFLVNGRPSPHPTYSAAFNSYTSISLHYTCRSTGNLLGQNLHPTPTTKFFNSSLQLLRSTPVTLGCPLSASTTVHLLHRLWSSGTFLIPYCFASCYSIGSISQFSFFIFFFHSLITLFGYFPPSFFAFGVGEGGSVVTDVWFIFFLMLRGWIMGLGLSPTQLCI